MQVTVADYKISNANSRGEVVNMNGKMDYILQQRGRRLKCSFKEISCMNTLQMLYLGEAGIRRFEIVSRLVKFNLRFRTQMSFQHLFLTFGIN